MKERIRLYIANIKKLGLWLFKRGIVLYFGIFLFVAIFADLKQANEKAIVKILNYMLPNFDYLQEYDINTGKFNSGKFWLYWRYYLTVERFTDSSDSSLILGYLAFCNNDISTARKYYTRAVKQDPQFFYTYFNLAEFFYTQAKYDLAFEYFQKALAMDKFYSFKRLLGSKIYIQILSGEGKSSAELKTRLEERYLLSYERMIQCYINKNDYNSALKLINEGIKKQYNDPLFFFYYKGIALMGLQQFAEAGGYFKEILHHEPNHAASLLAIAKIAHVMGEEELAKGFFAKAALSKDMKMDKGNIEKNTIELRTF
ncbi:MAG: tetratricopeptide repeat protein [Candidatus Omnitrophica bacterium]|nr:tetratricopeptide repeat protein [Candidatus Omnitrophota bacterium]